MIAKLPLVPFVIINLTRLIAGNHRFFSSRRFADLLRLKENLWDQGIICLTRETMMRRKLANVVFYRLEWRRGV